MTESILLALLGGALIGVAALSLVVFNGRISGISGILGGALQRGVPQWWRWAFIGGLFAGGLLVTLVHPEAFVDVIDQELLLVAGAGLLVGFGTRLGGGCTSGHGICGISRLGPRSFVATGVFMATGIVTAIVAH
ncbi:MAG: YeeE/YedE family protein [Proteobacteria bacterium]|nr:MAG: YeeE/YedE family protein [Pseudomonadota bacterium]